MKIIRRSATILLTVLAAVSPALATATPAEGPAGADSPVVEQARSASLQNGHLRNRHNGECLTVQWDGRGVFTYQCVAGAVDQWWDRAGETFVVRRNGECLTVGWNNNNVFTYPCRSGSPDQQWQYVGDAQYRNRHNNQCLTVAWESNDTFTYQCVVDAVDQQWDRG